MADTESKQGGGGPQAMLKALLGVLAIAVVAVVGVWIWKARQGPGSNVMVLGGGTTNTTQVAMLDSEAIYALPEFTAVKNDLEKLSNEKEELLLKTIKEKKLNAEEAERLRQQMRDELQQEQARRVTPLNKRVTVAIAQLAKERGYKVVLDKRIVVTGVADVTDDVKKKFESLKGVDLSKETAETADAADSSVGYVNQETIGELRLFKEAQQSLMADYQSMAVDLQKKTKDKSPAEKDKRRQDMARAFQEKQVEVMKPVNDKVTAAITDVAKEKGLSLVLNSHHVMWGGRNLTDDVIKKLI
jgi:outer membrane protein